MSLRFQFNEKYCVVHCDTGNSVHDTDHFMGLGKVADVRPVFKDYGPLFAVAPEMLHALKLAFGYFRDAAKQNPEHFAGYEKLLKTVIAKAEGKEAT